MVTKTKVRTKKQLEREYQQYIEATRKAARKLKRSRPKVKPPRVVTQHVKLGVGGRAIWGKVRHWTRYPSVIQNLKAAITFAHNTLHKHQIGTVVYIGGADVWHAKMGNDGSYFTSWKFNPAAEYWKRRLNS